MFRQVLVALDRSKYSERVLNAGMTLAKAEVANLILVQVLSNEERDSPLMPTSNLLGYPVDTRIFEDYQEHWQKYQQEGLDLLKSYADKAISAGVKTEFVQANGSPGRTICEIARDRGVDLIVIGRRGLSGLNELILGSVSNYVIHHAGCSVLTVQG